MSWMSPNELYADPKRWLNVPHQFHEALLELMGKMYGDFEEKLLAIGCNCLACQGKDDIEVELADGTPKLLTGWVERPEKLLQLRDRS